MSCIISSSAHSTTKCMQTLPQTRTLPITKTKTRTKPPPKPCPKTKIISEETPKTKIISEETRKRRRDILVGLVGALGAWHGNHAEAAESKRVRLKDVEDERVRNALRAAVAGDLEKAETDFSELIRENPESASMWSNRGSVRLSLSKFEDAADDFSHAIKLAPDAPVPFFNRCIAYQALGLYEQAIEDCKSAIVNDPEESAAWFNLGNVDATVEDYDAALVAYERASTLAPGIAGYLLREALVLFQLNRIREAKKLFEGLVRKYPNYAEAHAALAAILWSEGSSNKAEDQFTEAVTREPLYKNIGWVKNTLQWPPNIIQALDKFILVK